MNDEELCRAEEDATIFGIRARYRTLLPTPASVAELRGYVTYLLGETDRLRGEQRASRGEVIKACPICKSVCVGKRGYMATSYTCADCRSVFDEPAYWQRVPAPSAVGAK